MPQAVYGASAAPQVVNGASAAPQVVNGASAAPPPTMGLISALLRKLTMLLVALTMAVTVVAVEAPRPVEAGSEAGRIIYTAKNQLGKRYQWGATGMRRYDCSGLVYRVFERNGLLSRFGGGRKTAKGYYRWFRDRGLASKSNPRKGDLVVWGRGVHIGIYAGDGKAISALTSGVRRHGVRGLNVGFTAYLKVKLRR
ncbi:MAG: NlpC/P60 family protein [Chloroflexota bacterium]|nr:NlpC/P60 family protein [Chloroflexota bacterium]